jgi:hypothetical protein
MKMLFLSMLMMAIALASQFGGGTQPVSQRRPSRK